MRSACSGRCISTNPLDPARPAGHHEDDRIRIVTAAKIELTKPDADVAQGAGGVGDLLGQLLRLAPELGGDVVVLVQVVEGLVVVDVVVDVLDVLGRVVRQVLDLADQRRDQQRPEPDRDQDQDR